MLEEDRIPDIKSILAGYLRLIAFIVCFYPFISLKPEALGEHQPFFLFFISAALIFSLGEIKEIVSLNRNLVIIFISCVTFLFFDYIFITKYVDIRYMFRYANLFLGVIFFSTIIKFKFLDNLWIFNTIAFTYIIIAYLQVYGVIPAQIRSLINFSHREVLTYTDYYLRGRGVPSLATEAATFLDIMCALVVTKMFSSTKDLSPFVILNIVIVLIIAAFLGKSTTYIIITLFVLFAYNFHLMMNYKWRKLFLGFLSPLILVLLVGSFQTRTRELLNSYYSLGFDGLLSKAGDSLNIRMTYLFRLLLPENIFEYTNCVHYFYNSNICINDSTGILGFYLISPDFITRSIVLLFYWFLALILITSLTRLSEKNFLIATISVISLQIISTNSPFFPLYIVIFFASTGYLKLPIPSQKPIQV